MIHKALPERRRNDRGARFPRRKRNHAPKQKVYETYELTEHKLSFLPPRDMFVCQRVSKAFKAVIDDSHALQELMFLRVTGALRQLWQLDNLDATINGHGEGTTSIDPAAGLALLSLPSVPAHCVEHYLASHRILTPAIMNPMILRSLIFNDRERNPDRWNRNESDYIMLMPEFHILREPNGPKLQNILCNFKQDWSLLDTYLTNPPCRQAWIEYRALRVPSRISRIEFSGLLEVETVITMGHVLNAPCFVRGVAEFQRLVPTQWQPYVEGRVPPAEVHSNVTLNEVLESFYGEDGEPVDLYGHLRCAFLDTIIPTDKMRVGVAPYAEDVMAPDVEAGDQSVDSGDKGWASDEDEEMEDLSEEDLSAEDLSTEENFE